MRLLAASLIAGGCLLGASAASAEPLRLDDPTLDQVTAGITFASVETRRDALIASAAGQIAESIAETGDPIVDAARNVLLGLAGGNGNGDDNGGDANGFPSLGTFPGFPAIPPIGNLF